MLPAAGAISKQSAKGRRIIETGPYLCAACVIIIITAGCFGFSPSVDQLVILVPLGVVLSKLLAIHYKDRSKFSGQLAFGVGLVGVLCNQATRHHSPLLIQIFSLVSNMACMFGITFLIFACFRQLLLRFLEEAD